MLTSIVPYDTFADINSLFCVAPQASARSEGRELSDLVSRTASLGPLKVASYLPTTSSCILGDPLVSPFVNYRNSGQPICSHADTILHSPQWLTAARFGRAAPVLPSYHLQLTCRLHIHCVFPSFSLVLPGRHSIANQHIKYYTKLSINLGIRGLRRVDTSDTR